jgi:BirA family biotin operon repressor/biotin-[acetyl-CoA-carboxylase] ligase
MVTEGHFDVLAEQWEERCSTLGRQITIHLGDRVIRGRAESLDNDGALLVRDSHGHIERIIGGDVTLDSAT